MKLTPEQESKLEEIFENEYFKFKSPESYHNYLNEYGIYEVERDAIPDLINEDRLNNTRCIQPSKYDYIFIPVHLIDKILVLGGLP